MQRPVPRAAITYKKPAAINPVSVVVFLLLGAMIYLAYCYWPNVKLKSNAKSELQESLVHFYRLNLRPDKHQLRTKELLKKSLQANLAKVGVTDPNLHIEVAMDPKSVSLEARFVSPFDLAGLGKRYIMNHHIRVQTDAARVEW